MSEPWDPVLVWLAVAAVSVLMGQAAVKHLTDRLLFDAQLQAYRVPEWLALPLSWLLPAAEALTVLLMLVGQRGRGAMLAATLLTLYGGAMAWQRLQGRRPLCGCGGDELPVSWILVARNAVLVVVAWMAGMPVSRPLGWGDALVVVAGLALAVLIYAAAHQLLRVTPPSSTTRWRT